MNDRELGDQIGVVLREMYPEPVDVEMATAHRAPHRASHRSALLAGVVGAALIVTLVAILKPYADHPHLSMGSGIPTTTSTASSPTPSPTNNESLTARDLATANAIARTEAVREQWRPGTPLTATATIDPGTVTDSNTGHPCTSGTLLRITLIGDFNIPTGGLYDPSGTTAYPADAAVHGVLITADPVSKNVCLISVQVGKVTADPTATILFKEP